MSKDTYLQLLLKVFFSFGKYVYKRDAFKKVSYRHPLIFVFNFFLKADFLYIKLAETHLKLIKCFLCYSRNVFYSYIYMQIHQRIIYLHYYVLRIYILRIHIHTRLIYTFHHNFVLNFTVASISFQLFNQQTQISYLHFLLLNFPVENFHLNFILNFIKTYLYIYTCEEDKENPNCLLTIFIHVDIDMEHFNTNSHKEN